MLYGLWWIGWGHKADTHLSLHNFATTFRFVFDAVAAGMASLFGLATPTPETAVGGLDWGRPIMVTALLFAGWRLHRLSSIPRWLWVVAAIGASFWALGGLNVIPGRGPTVSRYQYPSAIFIMLIAAELLQGVRIGRRTLIALSLLATASVASNIAFLHDSYKSYKLTSDLERADLGAVEITRRTVDPAFTLSEDIADTAYVNVQAGAYLSAVDDFGSPAYTPEELIKAPEPPRVAADKVLAAALRIKLFLQRGTPAGRGAPPKVIGPRSGLMSRNGGCVTVSGKGSVAPVLDLPAGGVTMRPTGSARTELQLERFSSSFPVSIGELVRGVNVPQDPGRSGHATVEA